MLRSVSRLAGLSAAILLAPTPAAAQTDDHGVLVIATAVDATNPVPGLEPAATSYEIANLLFLRLADLGPTLTTVGDRGFTPRLARRWSRRDSVTLVFELQPDAVWHDGHPVTAKDVVFTWRRSREIPYLATAIQRIASVTAEGTNRVVFQFRYPYSEQLYDATYHMMILPEHLLAEVPQDKLAGSEFARHPVGSGPFRWVRRVPGQLIELAAFDRFFAGRPHLDRVYFRIVGDPEARLNLLLSGEADAVQYLTVTQAERLEQNPNIEVVPVVSGAVTYGVFNFKANGDSTRPHPVFTDPAVRRALVLALDRATMAHAVYGNSAGVPDGPVPLAFAWVSPPDRRPPHGDTSRARRLLTEAGWIDHDGDGVLDHNGVPLEFTIITPNSSPQRPMLAAQMQERYRLLGIRARVEPMAFSVWNERRNRGQFDIAMSSALLDPTPSGWRNSWSCATAGRPSQNVGSYCNPAIDSLLNLAERARNPVPLYRRILEHIGRDVPAVFLSSPATLVAVHGRYGHRAFNPVMLWQDLDKWTVTPGRQIGRDRGRGH